MHVYKCLLTLYNNFSSDTSMRGRFLQCLGKGVICNECT